MPGNQGTKTRARPAVTPSRSEARAATRPVHAASSRACSPIAGARCRHLSSRSRRTSRSPSRYELKATFDERHQPAAQARRCGSRASRWARCTRSSRAATTRPHAVVTMKIKDAACRSTRTPTLKIRPRIFLEGNFFVDLKPGTPAADEVDSGRHDPDDPDLRAGADRPGARRRSRRARKCPPGPAEGLRRGASPASPKPDEDGDQDPITRGETAGQSLNDAIDYGEDAFKGTALVNEALLGSELHDLSKLIAGQQKVFTALVAERGGPQGLHHQLQPHHRCAGRRGGQPPAHDRHPSGAAANGRRRPSTASMPPFPPTRAFAKEILPGVRETPATLEASFPWIDQVRALVSPAELQGLVNDLRPAVARPRGGHRRHHPAAAAGGPRQPLLQRRDPARRATSRSTTASSPPACRTTRSSGRR